MMKCLGDIRLTSRDAFLFRTPYVSVDESSLRIFHDLRMGETSSAAAAVSMEAGATSKDGSINLNVGAKALLGNCPALNGFIGKLNKKKKWDRLFGVVHENYLFLYKTQNDAQPLATLQMDQYDVSVMEEKKKKTFVKNGIDVTPKASVDKKLKLEEHALKADNEQWVKQWVDALTEASSTTSQAPTQGSNKRHTKKGLKDVDAAPLVFGAPLANAVSAQDGSELPAIVTQTISWVEKHALKAEGIFRLSGSANEIMEYKRRYDLGEPVSFEHEQDPHNVAGLLKLYFREMPEPLLTWEMFFMFIMADFVENRFLRLRYIKYLISRLPALNRALLKFLVRFLIRVAAHADVNKMAIHNLATVFGPNLLRQKDANMIQMVEHTPQINSMVDTMIKNYDYFFDNGPLEAEGDKFAGTAGRALYDYEGQAADDLSFKRGDIIPIIYNKGEGGWWHGELSGKFGKFPASYVEVVDREVWVKADRKISYHAEMAQLQESMVEEAANIERLDEKRERLQQELDRVREEKREVRAQAEKVAAVLNDTLQGDEKVFRHQVKEICVKLDLLRSGRDGVSAAMAKYTEVSTEVTIEMQDIVADAKRKKDKKLEKQMEKMGSCLQAINKALSAEQSARRRSVRLEDEVRQDVDMLEVLTGLSEEENTTS
eukprot:TRINITY_DN1510_c0_g1_i2.p1 TRINITY_DN1510_c0_g1~~TRINITY_DN1510_c0_g1_i2.p1  ORF type:complete len:658 (-),score=229.98 TRINITY_DN1510_c0_g1_i2:210-2183(-)